MYINIAMHANNGKKNTDKNQTAFKVYCLKSETQCYSLNIIYLYT